MNNPDEQLPLLLTTATATAPATATATTASGPAIFGPRVSEDHSPRRNVSKLRIGPTSGGISKPRVGKKLNPNPSSSSGSGGVNDNNVPCICSECGKRFGSWKALFGHMRCHPERQWRGMIPPPNFRPGGPVMLQASSSDPWLTMTEEDYEVAECLLMLANSGPTTTQDPPRMEEIHPEHVDDGELIGDTGGPAGRFECSSCKKVFGSHQALGGHRASHKNVKGCFALTSSVDTELRECGDKSGSPSMSRPATNSSSADTDLDLDLRLGI